MARLRFSVRGLMILVLVMALLIAGERTVQTRKFRLTQAQQYHAESQSWRATQRTLARRLEQGTETNPAATREVMENHRLWAEYTRELARWYDRGASRPWMMMSQAPRIPPELDGGGETNPESEPNAPRPPEGD